MRLKTLEQVKLERFQKGWNEFASHSVAPSAVKKKGDDTFKTWEQLLEPLTIFEAYRLGQTEGAAYARAVAG